MWEDDSGLGAEDDNLAGSRKSKNAVVDINMFVDELTGLVDEEGSMFLARWRRGREHTGETQYQMVSMDLFIYLFLSLHLSIDKVIH